MPVEKKTCQDFTDLLEQLCSLRGVSGQEQEVAKWVYERLKKSDPDYLHADNMGNIYATRRGQGKALHLMLVAHLDEVGGIVSEVCENGTLRFRTVGCVNAATLPSIRVRVGDLPAAVSAPPAHMQGGAINPDDLVIDIGARSREEALKMGAQIGVQVTFDTPFTRLTERRVCSRVIDDRVGCAVLLKLFEDLDFTPAGDVTVAFSVREETTMTGAAMLVEQVRPDWVIAIDTVPIRMSSSGNALIDIGYGPVFQLMEGVMSAFVGNAAHIGVKKALMQAGDTANVPYQLCAEVGSWTTDGAALHAANGGTPSGYLSIPRRYAHSASELLDVTDAVNGIMLLRQLIDNMADVVLSII